MKNPKNLPKAKFTYTEGLIKQLETKVSYLEQRIKELQEEVTKAARLAAAPSGQQGVPQRMLMQGLIDSGYGVGIRGGIAKYIDVERTFLTDSYGGHRSVLQSLTSSKNNVVWDTTAGCYKFYGVYKE